ncbi:methyl-accepting chemotaxis protein [Marinospirillum perlucidum]|uniref:methyl-accepting chemotaxis protein n=1 Tax=Marinospirillum perlucidum TaxID=1982602 RepID=UPI000DF13521|nr:methyl-accepting chemotaxis protein [Marinospirillum perlucidum]
MLQKLYNVKLWIRLVGVLWLLLVLSWTGMIGWASWEQRKTAYDQSQVFAYSLYESTMAGLTTMMLTGTIDQRDAFLDQITELQNVSDLRVIRSEHVKKQFGEGTESEQSQDALEQQVLREGTPYLAVDNEAQVLRAIIPAFNRTDYLGKNCTLCHAMAPEGAVLGAVTMNISLEDVNNEANSFSIKLFTLAVIISFILLGIVYIFVRLFITNPLHQMTKGMQEVARGGKNSLQHQLEVKGQDEIGQASSAFNQVLQRFATLVEAIRNSVTGMQGSVERLAEVADTTSRAATSQQDQTDQVATAMNEMTATVQEVSQSAVSAADSAQNARDRAANGKEVVMQTIAMINTLARDIQEADSVIQEVESNTENIGVVLQVIRDVAEQTNLLALNAAIEAARAGEAGRGFAVVADEVRNLAQRTQDSTQDIEDQVARLQEKTRKAVEVMQHSRKQAEEGMQQASQGDEALDTITEGVDSISDMTSQIASAAEEQSSVANEIDRNIIEISQMAENTSSQAQEAVQVVEQLRQIARDLGQLINEEDR